MLSKVAHKNILCAIGNTPIVKLNNVVSHDHINFFVKCENLNPGGSIKDRIALHMLNMAEKEGKIYPEGTIIEATSGNTGCGLAMVAAIRGYKCIFVMADKQSVEKQNALKSLGAEVIICPTDVDPKDPQSYYSVADKLSKTTANSFYVNQYANPHNPQAHYLYTGPEIWQQCGYELDVLVCGIGTGGTVSGCGKYLREKNSNIKIIGVDPIGSIYYELFYKGTMPKAHGYLIEGIGEDFIPKTMDLQSMDEIIQVSDEESFAMAKRLNSQEALLVGGSSGSAVAGAIKYADQFIAKTNNVINILTIMPDSSSRYLSKFLNNNWFKSHFP